MGKNKKYEQSLSQHPRWIVTCNFQEFLVYDMEQPIYGYVQPGLRLMDVGKLDTLSEAEAFVQELFHEAGPL